MGRFQGRCHGTLSWDDSTSDDINGPPSSSVSCSNSSSRATGSSHGKGAQPDTAGSVPSGSWNPGGDSMVSSSLAADFDSLVSLLRGDHGATRGPDKRQRFFSRLNTLLVASLCVFAGVCVAAVFADRKWNLFGGEGAPAVPVETGGIAAAKLHAVVVHGTTTTSTANLSSDVTPAPTMMESASALMEKHEGGLDEPGQGDTTEKITVHASSSRGTTTHAAALASRTRLGPRQRRRPRPPPTLRNRRSSFVHNDSSEEYSRAREGAHRSRTPRTVDRLGLRHAALQCRAPLFSVCRKLRTEIYYRPDAGACVLTSATSLEIAQGRPAALNAAALTPALSLCNRSPNRFVSLQTCRRSCVEGHMPAQRCFDKPIFAGCSRHLVQPTWWFFDGYQCRPWSFLDGKCPNGHRQGGGGKVFRSRGQCMRKCGVQPVATGYVQDRHKMRQPRCRRPPGRDCTPQELRFPYFADASSSWGGGSLRCLRVSPDTVLARRCLVGANRFSDLGECRRACVGRRARVRTESTWRGPKFLKAWRSPSITWRQHEP